MTCRCGLHPCECDRYSDDIDKRCACGRVHDAAAWRALPYVGRWQLVDDEPALELRNCPCGSTLARRMLSMLEVDAILDCLLGGELSAVAS